MATVKSAAPGPVVPAPPRMSRRISSALSQAHAPLAACSAQRKLTWSGESRSLGILGNGKATICAQPTVFRLLTSTHRQKTPITPSSPTAPAPAASAWQPPWRCCRRPHWDAPAHGTSAGRRTTPSPTALLCPRPSSPCCRRKHRERYQEMVEGPARQRPGASLQC